MTLFLICLAGAAAAHTERYPKRDRLELSATRARVVLDHAVPAGADARALREIFDRDQSGTLDAGEQQALARYLAAQATHFTSLMIDGRVVALAQVEQVNELEPGAQGRVAVRLTLEAAVALAPGSHRVRFADRHKDRRLAVPVTLVLDGLASDSKLPPQPFVDDAHPLEFTAMLQK